MIQPSLLPIAALQECSLDEANALLRAWDHKMGPLERGTQGYAKARLLRAPARDSAGRGGHQLDADPRSRRRWPGAHDALQHDRAVAALRRAPGSQPRDALHRGHTYRFDGWTRSEAISRSGTDARSGKRGRRKWVWWWELPTTNAVERAIMSAGPFFDTPVRGVAS